MGKYDDLVFHLPLMHMTVNEDGRLDFHGFMANQSVHGQNFKMGFQIVTKPLYNDNPAHTHNFQEFIAWYGLNPDDPFEFDAEVELYLGEEMEKHVFTQPTIVSFPPGFVHAPLAITRVGKPICQIEVMLPPADGSAMTREPFFEKDKGVDPYDLVTISYIPQPGMEDEEA